MGGGGGDKCETESKYKEKHKVCGQKDLYYYYYNSLFLF